MTSRGSPYTSLVTGLKIIPAQHILEVTAYLVGSKNIAPYIPPAEITVSAHSEPDLADIYGQKHAKRALEIAAAGGHGLMMVGPPGVGKTMLANALVTILPEPNEEEILETAAIYSISGKQDNLKQWQKRPFRAPHHTASSVALVGGSNPPCPGEISLAHNGVLFLDELLEFKRGVLEALREPLESKQITISRAAHQAKFPAKFQLVTAMNPCPCGYFGDSRYDCNCTCDQIKRYHQRISGPFLDRIDLWVLLSSLPRTVLLDKGNNESSKTVKARVVQARKFALSRANKINEELTNREVEEFCHLIAKDQQFLEEIFEKLKLSLRSYHRILKVARTIADLEENPSINANHLKEALGYRRAITRP